MLDPARVQHTERLAPYARRLFDGLVPILGRLDQVKMGDKSSIEIQPVKHGYMLQLLIYAVDPSIPILSLTASPGQCILGYADSEQIECHSDPDGSQDLVPTVLEAVSTYLNGITIVEHYNKNDRLVTKEYFFGIDGDGQAKRQFGVGGYPLVFPKKIVSSKTRTYRFFR